MIRDFILPNQTRTTNSVERNDGEKERKRKGKERKMVAPSLLPGQGERRGEEIGGVCLCQALMREFDEFIRWKRRGCAEDNDNDND